MDITIGVDAAKLAGLQIDILQKVRAGHITLAHIEWFGGLTREERDRLSDNRAKKFTAGSILKLISGGKTLEIDAADGTEILAEANDVFAWIDSDFKAWGVDEKGSATGKTSAAVYEMVKDATFAQMFGSMSDEVKKLCLTQAQIKGFVKKHRNWLRTCGYATFFLFESKGDVFVANVRFLNDGKLGVDVNRFENDNVWHADYCHRVVIPQLA